jgi:hypothetical protein
VAGENLQFRVPAGVQPIFPILAHANFDRPIELVDRLVFLAFTITRCPLV